MVTSIMQPYFMPYIGYWQLLQVADIFVIYDDVAFINKGWINRNQILTNNVQTMFTIPLIGASQNKKINEIEIEWKSNWEKKFIKTIEQSYSKSISYKFFIPVLTEILNYKTEKISDYIAHSIQKMVEYLEINVTILQSEIYQNSNLKAQDRIIDICKQTATETYINAIGGKSLYDIDSFRGHQIDLKFIESLQLPYSQKSKTFIPYLSIIDLCMNVEQKDIKNHLNSYQFI